MSSRKREAETAAPGQGQDSPPAKHRRMEGDLPAAEHKTDAAGTSAALKGVDPLSPGQQHRKAQGEPPASEQLGRKDTHTTAAQKREDPQLGRHRRTDGELPAEEQHSRSASHTTAAPTREDLRSDRHRRIQGDLPAVEQRGRGASNRALQSYRRRQSQDRHVYRQPHQQRAGTPAGREHAQVHSNWFASCCVSAMECED